MEDDHVDRPGVDAQQCVQLTGTNRSFGLIALVAKARQKRTKRPPHQRKSSFASANVLRRPGGPRRGDQTRSHPELGRQTPPRQWYFVSRHGRVGRRQARQERSLPLCNPSDLSKGQVGNRQSAIGSRQTLSSRLPFAHPRLPASPDAGWSSPVARQAHNLKVTGSNPVPATNDR